MRPLRDPVIKALNIRLTPRYYPNSDHAPGPVNVEVEVIAGDGRHTFQLELHQTDFECRLDQYFDVAKEQIRKAVKEWNPDR